MLFHWGRRDRPRLSTSQPETPGAPAIARYLTTEKYIPSNLTKTATLLYGLRIPRKI